MRTASRIGLADLADAFLHLKPDTDGSRLIAHALGISAAAAAWHEIEPPYRPTETQETPPPAPEPATKQSSIPSGLTVELVTAATQDDVVPEAIRRAKALPISREMLHRTPAPLLRPQQIRAFLQDHVGQLVLSETIDLDATVEQLARLSMRTFPRMRRKGFRRGVTVVIDYGPSMDPFREDVAHLHDAVQRFIGPQLIDTCEVSRSPFEYNISRFTRPGATVLLVSDLGIGRSRGTHRSWPEEWIAFSKQLVRAGQRVVAIVPYEPGRWPHRSGIEIAHWHEPTAQRAANSATQVEDLARALSIAGRIDAALVRAVRRKLFPASDAGLEADFLFSHLLAVSTLRTVVFHDVELHRLRAEIAKRPTELDNARRALVEYRKEVGPENVALEEDIVYFALRKLPGDRKEIEQCIATILRTILDRSDDVDLARWSSGLLDELPAWARALNLVEWLEEASQLRLGFASTGRRTHPVRRMRSWLLPRETTIAGIAREHDALIVREPAETGDSTITVPSTNPRVVVVHAYDKTEPAFVRFSKGQPGRIEKPSLPIEIETLSGARIRVSADDRRAPATEKEVRVRVFEGHAKDVNRVAMPEDGRFALTSSDDGTVRKWELGASDETSKIVCHGESFGGLAVTADGSYAVAGDVAGSIRLINLSSSRKLRQWQGHEDKLGNLAFLARDREVLSTGEDGYLRRWNTKTGRRIAQCKLPFNYLSGVAAAVDGSRVVGAASSQGLALWSGREGAEPIVFKEDTAGLSPVSLTADGRFAFIGVRDGKVAQWDLTEGRRIAAFEGHSDEVSAVVVTPNGRFCVSGSWDHSIRLWAANTGQCLAILRGHRGDVNGVAITPDARRIASVSDDRTLRVWDIPEAIIARAATARKRGYVNAKVVLLGDSGVGKSGLALRLWHDRWEKTESSHGMEIQRLTLPQAGGDPDVEREVWLWDFPGQPDYRLTHQFFIEQTSLALLVFDPHDSKVFDTLGYWQSALRKVVRTGNVTGVLVAARCDRPGMRLTMDEVRTWAAARGLHGPILTAAKLKRHPGVDELRDLIAKLLPWETMEFRSTMENFPALKDAILAIREDKGGGLVVKPSELESRVRRAAPYLTFTAEELRAVTGLLAGEGVLYALPYGDLVVLQPRWVNSYASTLVKLAGDAEHLGHVPLATIQPGLLPNDGTPRLSLEDERQLLPALIALFLQYALAWKQDTDKGAMLVFPSYMRLPRPEPPPRPGRTVLYRFAGPLEEIYSTLVVRLHYSGLFASTKLYRQAVDFQTVTGKLAALTMQEQGERGELEIYFGVGLDADLQAFFQRFVHDHLKAKATGLERLRNFFCPKCGEEADRKAVDAALQKNRTKLVCVYCDPDHAGIIDLNDVLEQQLASGEGKDRADRAARKANEEIISASKEGVMVGEVQTIVFSADQIYRSVLQPDEGIDGEIEFRNARKKATGLGYRVQLKSGDSHLKRLRDGTERFPIKNHCESLWTGKGHIPVLLIIRTSDGRIRFMNATEAIRAAQKANPGQPVKQIVFTGEDFTKEAVLRLRDERLGLSSRA